MLNCRKTCLSVSPLIKAWLWNINFHLNPTAVQASICVPYPTVFVCVTALDGQHWNTDKSSILMERSAKGSFSPLGPISTLWSWSTGLQANNLFFYPRRKVGRRRAGRGADVGRYKEILLQQAKKSPLRAGFPQAVAHASVVQLTSHLAPPATSAPAVRCICSRGQKQSFFRHLEKSSKHFPMWLNWDHTLYSFAPWMHKGVLAHGFSTIN